MVLHILVLKFGKQMGRRKIRTEQQQPFMEFCLLEYIHECYLIPYNCFLTFTALASYRLGR